MGVNRHDAPALGASIEHSRAAPLVAVMMTHSLEATPLPRMGAGSAAGCGQAAT
jgi:hypothetical protein